MSDSGDLLIACAALTGWEYRRHDKYRLDIFERGQTLIAVTYDKRGGIRLASRGSRYGGQTERLGRDDSDKAETVLRWMGEREQ